MFDLFGNERRRLQKRIELLGHQNRVLQNHLKDSIASTDRCEYRLDNLRGVLALERTKNRGIIESLKLKLEKNNV